MVIFGKIMGTKDKVWKSGPALEVTLVNHEGIPCTVHCQIEEHNNKFKQILLDNKEEDIIFITDVSSSDSGMLFVNRL